MPPRVAPLHASETSGSHRHADNVDEQRTLPASRWERAFQDLDCVDEIRALDPHVNQLDHRVGGILLAWLKYRQHGIRMIFEKAVATLRPQLLPFVELVMAGQALWPVTEKQCQRIHVFEPELVA